MYNKQKTSLSRISNNGGRKKTIMQDVFEPATSENSYWLGWLMANTSLVTGTNKREIAHVNTHVDEKDHMRACMTFLNIGNNTCQPHGETISFRSGPLVDLLNAHGVVKSRRLRSSDGVPKAFLMDFWRGYVNANSHVAINADHDMFLNIQATETLLPELVAYLKNNAIEISHITSREITLLNNQAVAFYNILIDRGEVSLLSLVYHENFEIVVSRYEDSIAFK